MLFNVFLLMSPMPATRVAIVPRQQNVATESRECGIFLGRKLLLTGSNGSEVGIWSLLGVFTDAQQGTCDL